MAAAASIMRRHFSHALASCFSPRWTADSAGVAGVNKSICITQGPHAQGHQARLRVVQAFRLPHGRQRHVRRSQSKSTQGFGERSICPLVREWVLAISRTHACTPVKKSDARQRGTVTRSYSCPCSAPPRPTTTHTPQDNSPALTNSHTLTLRADALHKIRWGLWAEGYEGRVVPVC